MSIIRDFLAKHFSYPVSVAAPLNSMPEPTGNQELPPHDSPGMVKCAVIVGHTLLQPGARLSNGTRSEYPWNAAVAAAMSNFSKDFPGVVIEIILRDKIGILGAYEKARSMNCDCAVELHFNAADGKATGTETLCSVDGDDVAFAHIFQKAMCTFFNRTGSSRGVKVLSKADRGGINVYSFPGGPNCLVEPFFGDSEPEMAADIPGYAKSLLGAVQLWAKHVDLIRTKPPTGVVRGPLPVPAQAQSPQKPPTT